jgi:hypothetical protein
LTIYKTTDIELTIGKKRVEFKETLRYSDERKNIADLFNVLYSAVRWLSVLVVSCT